MAFIKKEDILTNTLLKSSCSTLKSLAVRNTAGKSRNRLPNYFHDLSLSSIIPCDEQGFIREKAKPPILPEVSLRTSDRRYIDLYAYCIRLTRSLSIFDFLELLFAQLADRTNPVVRQVCKRRPGGNTLLGVTFGRVIHIFASQAFIPRYIRVHIFIVVAIPPGEQATKPGVL